nr:MAG TPA: minor tail protein [Caudoviricetes sp.]
MADVDITSLSVEISAESQGAELNIDKLATAISNLRTKGNVGKVCSSLDTLTKSISALRSASSGMDGLSRINDFMDGISKVNLSESAKGIRSVASALTRISSVDLKGLDLSGLKGKMNSLQNGLSPLSKVDASGLRSVSSALNSIAKIPDFSSKLDSKTLDDFATSCKKIADALDPLASKIETVGNSFAKLPSNIQKVIAATDGATKASNKSAKGYLSLSSQLNGFMQSAAKLVSLKAIAEYLGNAVAKFNDFYEATDLFHNAMGNLSGEADTLISKMQGLLGVDPTKAMTYMATIQSLGTSFGLTSDKAYILSKNLTQLSYDEGSYWNKDVAETFTAMSSAISGEIEPIRRLGVDLSQARLQQELLALGFNKQVSSLSQADKAVLRYIAIMKQTSNVQGNLAQTIQSPANQIKILKAQLDMLAKSVGSLLYPAMKSILPPLIAAVQLIREFVQWVAKLMGVKVVFTDFTKSADSVGGIGDAMDDTADSTKKAAKALKDYTMGFDELNIIDPTQGSSGSGSGASAGNILGDVDLSGYDMFKQYNEGFAKQIDAIKQKIKDLIPTIGAVGAAFAAWQISKALLDALDKIKNFTINAKVDISWPVLGVLAFMSDMNEFKKYLEDFLKNGPTFKNVAGMISEFAGMMGDALILLGNLKFGGALKVVQGIGEIIIAIKDIADNGLNWNNVTTAIRGLTNVAIGIGALTGHLKVAGWALAIQGFTSIIQEIADNWETIKNGDWSGVDKATLVIGALEVFGGIATALGAFSKLKSVKEATESVQSVKTVSDATQGVSNATSSLSPNLTSLAKNLAVGVAIVAEVSAAAILFAGAIVALGSELKAAGDAWQPVISNAKEVAEAVGLGSATLVTVGAATAGIGSVGGVPLATNIAIGTAILAEVGAAAVLFEAEVWAIGTGLDKIQQAWAPVTENAPAVKTALIAGTALLVAVGAATAAIGIATTATGGTIPIAIGIGTAVLVECAVAFVALTDSISSVADELTGKLYPSLKNLNSKLPSIKTGMSSLTGYLKDFAGELSSYTSSMGSVTWSSIVNGFQKLFVGNPIASLADDVGKIYDDTTTLNQKLSVANPELSKAVRLLTSYSDLMSQLKLLTDGASNTELASDIFINLKDCGEKLVTGFVSGIDGKLNSLNTEVGKIKTTLEKINDEAIVFETAGGNIIKGLIKGINGEKENAYTAIVEVGNKLAEKFETAMDINSPSKLFEQFGIYIDQGLANGITAALPYVEQAMTNFANAVQQKGNELIDYGADVANGWVDNFASSLDSKWNKIDSGLKNDFIGTIKGMMNAVKNGDIQTVAQNTAAIIWQAMGDENRKQVKSYASGLVSKLTSALKNVSIQAFSSAKVIGKNILSGITSKFGEISAQVVGLGSKIATSFSSLIGPISASGKAISIGLSSGVLSQFPSIIAGIAGLISQIGVAFVGMLQTIGGVLSSLGIPTGLIMIAGGVAIAAAIAGIVGTLSNKYGASSGSSVSSDYSKYPGTSDYDSSTGSTTSTGSYYPSSSTSGVSASDLRSAVHDGCYNAFLDIFQRYGDEITGGKEIKLFIDGKQITASVEKQQSDRGVQIMGTEVYSY